MSLYILHSEVVTVDCTAPGFGTVPPTDMIRPYFYEPFGEGSRRTPTSLTPLARVLDAIVRRTLLSRLGYREGLTRM
jgi:hypothetical protein